MPELLDGDYLPLLIGSMPYRDHRRAHAQVMAHTPDIPSWVQLPVFPEQGMVSQFLRGLPGARQTGGRPRMDAGSERFDTELLALYEAYMAITDGEDSPRDHDYGLNETEAPGFFTLIEDLASRETPPAAVKGQITGPFTFATGILDTDGQAIFYNAQNLDAAVKLLSVKARWQARSMSRFRCPVMIFMDEPALAGFGSSEFISVAREDVLACLEEVVSAIHAEGALAGIHVCANTDWSMIMEAGVDIINFDAYAYFDRFVLYPDLLRTYLDEGRMLAWGIVPTLDPEAIGSETLASLLERMERYRQAIIALGISEEVLADRSLITPSCGLGSLSEELAQKVLDLTSGLSARLRGD